MTSDYNILVSPVPIGGKALARLDTTKNGEQIDVTSIRTVWKDHLGVTIADVTRTTTDISTTGIHGEDVSLIDASGTGQYEARLEIDTSYSTVTLPVIFSLTVTITDPDGSFSKTFTFSVVASSLDISLDMTSVIRAVRRQTNLLRDVTYLAEGNEPTRRSNLVALGDEIVYGIEAAYKNGASFSTGSTGDTYSWVMFRPNVKLNTNPASNDHYLFTVKVGMSDAAVEDVILAATRRVQAGLAAHYDDSAILTYPTTLGLIQDIAVGEIRELRSRGIALESAYYRSGHDLKLEAYALLKSIQRGSSDVKDWNGDLVLRRAGSLVGGFRNANGPITDRGDWWTRLQDYQISIVRPFGQAEID